MAWRRGAETSLAISPQYATDHTLFAGSVGGLQETRDAGATWTRVTVPAALETGKIEAVAVSPDFARRRNVVGQRRGRRAVRSTDRGATWSPTGESLLRKDLVISNFYHATAEPLVFSPAFALDRTVFGFDGTTLVRSTDAGATWTTMASPDHEARHDPGLRARRLEATPRAEGASAPGSTATTDITGRKLAFAALFAVAALVALWVIERVSPRWRWPLRVVLALAVFGGVLWLLARR